MDVETKEKRSSKKIISIIVFVGILLIAIGFLYWKTYNKESLNGYEFETSTEEYLDKDDGFYIGELSEGNITGQGKYELDCGSSYEGAWNENSDPEGEGVLVLAGIGKYEGEFKNGLREGEGFFTWENGDYYVGEWSNDEISGTGVIRYTNGTVLNGIFEGNSLIQGSYEAKLDIGTITIYIDENSVNKAELVLLNGTQYIGELLNGKFNGHCKILYSNGDEYNGNVLENLKSGKGTYTWKDGAFYVGDWSDDKMNGEGIYYYTTSVIGKRLEGNFKDNLANGTMIYYDSNGKKYCTNWANGKCTKIERD